MQIADSYSYSEVMGQDTLIEILENVQDAVLIIDAKGTIIYINKAYTEQFGILPEKLLGKDLNKIEPDAFAMQAVRTGKPIFNKVSYVKSLNIDTIGITFPLFDVNHEIVGGCTLFENVTKLLRVAQELEKTQEMTAYLQEQLNQKQLPSSFDSYICNNAGMKEVIQLALKVAKTDSTVLIRGESGVGKEVLAKCIHAESKRLDSPMIKVNCASIPETLLESELFGYEEGAFTGAKKGGKIGKFELAHKGTIFLDEIGDMSFNMQAKLLRVLQEREMERVGGTKTIELDIRVIAATNRDLEQMIEAGTFRSDLYYRLNVVPLLIPPLRERYEDIMPLTRLFLDNLSDEEIGIRPNVKKILRSYEWPGNIRELQNVIEHAYIVRNGRNIEVSDLPKYLRPAYSGAGSYYNETTNLKAAVELLERDMIQETLERCQGNKSRAIKELGISRKAFYEKIAKYNLYEKETK